MIKKIPSQKQESNSDEKSVILFDEEYFSLFRHDHLLSFELRYKEAAYDLFHFEEIKRIIDIGISVVKQEIDAGYKYGILIINTIIGGPIIGKEGQNYNHTVLFPFLYEHQVMTHLLCLNEETMSKLSITLTAETAPEMPFNVHYFSKYEDCISYIEKL